MLLGWKNEASGLRSTCQSRPQIDYIISSPWNYHPNYYLSDWATHTIVLVIILASNSHHSTISLPWCYHDFTQVIPFLPWFTTWFWLFPGKQPGHLVLRRRARQRQRHRDHQVISIEFQSASLAKDLLLEKQVKTARDIIDLYIYICIHSLVI